MQKNNGFPGIALKLCYRGACAKHLFTSFGGRCHNHRYNSRAKLRITPHNILMQALERIVRYAV
jgi:hypothetical protein